MMADIFDQEVHVPESVESSCLGAAILGLYSLGEVDSLSIVSTMMGTTHQHVPNKDNVLKYQELGRLFVRISRLLTDEYRDIAAFQKKWMQ